MRCSRDISVSHNSYHYVTQTVSRGGRQLSADLDVNRGPSFFVKRTAASIRFLVAVFT